jgi:hypothetical protein
MVDMEPDDIEAIILLLIELETNRFSGAVTFIVGGASAYISRVRLAELIEAARQDAIAIPQYDIITGVSDPLNLKDEYWDDLKQSADAKVRRDGALYSSLTLVRETFEPKEISETIRGCAKSCAEERIEADKLDAVFRSSESCCVVCLKKPDELIWLYRRHGGAIFKNSVLWYYTGQYNVKPPKHEEGPDDTERFQKDVEEVAKNFGAVVIMSNFVIVQRSQEGAKRDMTELGQYAALCSQSTSMSLRLLNDRIRRWNSAMYRNWMIKGKVDSDLADLGKVIKTSRQAEAKTAIDGSTLKGFQKSASKNIIDHPDTQRTISDQLAVLLLFNREGDHKSGEPAFDAKGRLQVTGSGGNAFEILSMRHLTGQKATSNDSAIGLLDSVMRAALSKLLPPTQHYAS